MSDTLGLLLLSGSHERAHYAFVLACAAAVGRKVVLFVTNAGCHALAADWSALDGANRDTAVRASGVAGLDELRAAAELGVTLVACEAGLRVAGLDVAALMPGVSVAGVVTFLGATAGGQIISL